VGAPYADGSAHHPGPSRKPAPIISEFVLTPEIRATIVKAVREGNFPETAMTVAGVPIEHQAAVLAEMADDIERSEQDSFEEVMNLLRRAASKGDAKAQTELRRRGLDW
jgi:hypothetical protein